MAEELTITWLLDNACFGVFDGFLYIREVVHHLVMSGLPLIR